MRNIIFGVVVLFIVEFCLPVKAQNVSAGERANSKIDAALLAEISSLFERDQDVRNKLNGLPFEKWGDLLQPIDSITEKRLRAIVKMHGWPGRTLLGDDGSVKAWLLLQHCSLEFISECLPLLKDGVDRREVFPQNYAYLLDRHLMLSGKPQIYGTQYLNGKLYELDDIANVDVRRKHVGLGPIKEYIEQMDKQAELLDGVKRSNK